MIGDPDDPLRRLTSPDLLRDPQPHEPQNLGTCRKDRDLVPLIPGDLPVDEDLLYAPVTDPASLTGNGDPVAGFSGSAGDPCPFRRQFHPLPGKYFLVLIGVTLLYALIVSLVKRFYTKKYGDLL